MKIRRVSQRIWHELNTLCKKRLSRSEKIDENEQNKWFLQFLEPEISQIQASKCGQDNDNSAKFSMFFKRLIKQSYLKKFHHSISILISFQFSVIQRYVKRRPNNNGKTQTSKTKMKQTCEKGIQVQRSTKNVCKDVETNLPTNLRELFGWAIDFLLVNCDKCCI